MSSVWRLAEFCSICSASRAEAGAYAGAAADGALGAPLVHQQVHLFLEGRHAAIEGPAGRGRADQQRGGKSQTQQGAGGTITHGNLLAPGR